MSKSQDLAIALNMSRKRKKMAKGGKVEVSASNEPRPSTQAEHADSKEISKNSSKKAQPIDFKSESRPSAGPPKKTMPIKHPKIVGGSTFTSRLRDMRDEEDHQISSMPPKAYAKGGQISVQDSSAPSLSPLDGEEDEMSPSEDEIMSDRMPAYADGGMVDDEAELEHAASIAAAIMARRKMAQQHSDSSIDQQMHMAEGGALKKDTYGSTVVWNPDEPYRKNMSPDEEMAYKRLINSKREPQYRERLAEGGMVDDDQVDLDLNSMEQPNQYYRRNEEVLKENYDEDMKDMSQPEDSNLQGHEIESDRHDKVAMIRRRMKMKNAMTR